MVDFMTLMMINMVTVSSHFFFSFPEIATKQQCQKILIMELQTLLCCLIPNQLQSCRHVIKRIPTVKILSLHDMGTALDNIYIPYSNGSK